MPIVILKLCGGISHTFGLIGGMYQCTSPKKMLLYIDGHNVNFTNFWLFFQLRTGTKQIKNLTTLNGCQSLGSHRGWTINECLSCTATYKRHVRQKYCLVNNENILPVKPLGALLKSNDKFVVHTGRPFGNGVNVSCKLFVLQDWLCNEIVQRLKNKLPTEYAGIHFRNTDIRSDFHRFVQIAEKSRLNCVYIATDDFGSQSKFVEALPNKKLIFLTTPFNDFKGKITGTHKRNPDKRLEIINAFVDIAALVKAKTFSGCGISTFSKMVHALRTLEQKKTPHILTTVFERL